MKSKGVDEVVENKSYDFEVCRCGPGGIVYEQFGSGPSL